jgi:hypothetical protein
MTSKFACCGTPERVVDLIHNVGSTDGAMVEAPTVETLESLLSARYRVKLDVDVALGIRVNGDMNDLAVLLVALDSNLAFEILDPAIAVSLLFPVNS